MNRSEFSGQHIDPFSKIDGLQIDLAFDKRHQNDWRSEANIFRQVGDETWRAETCAPRFLQCGSFVYSEIGFIGKPFTIIKHAQYEAL